MDGTYTLVGMLDSPFVRRVAIALEVYGITYSNLPLATVGQAEEFAAYSPLKRAPTLLLPNGETLFDSHLILNYLDELMGSSVSLLPHSARDRLLCRQVMGIGAGLADKCVSALYERVFHEPAHQSQRLLARILGQITDSLMWLEERAPREGFLLGKNLSHGDIMVGAALCFALESHPDLVALGSYARTSSWYHRLASMDAFKKTYLRIDPPL